MLFVETSTFRGLPDEFCQVSVLQLVDAFWAMGADSKFKTFCDDKVA